MAAARRCRIDFRTLITADEFRGLVMRYAHSDLARAVSSMPVIGGIRHVVDPPVAQATAFSAESCQRRSHAGGVGAGVAASQVHGWLVLRNRCDGHSHLVTI